jgi:hypothetical protein
VNDGVGTGQRSAQIGDGQVDGADLDPRGRHAGAAVKAENFMAFLS